jgi:hypothetical protein
MFWRPYDCLIDGELDNRTTGKITGWVRFFRPGQKPLKLMFDLPGEFHEDIRGSVIRLLNPHPSAQTAGEDFDRKDPDAMRHSTSEDLLVVFLLNQVAQNLAREFIHSYEPFWVGVASMGEQPEDRDKQALHDALVVVTVQTSISMSMLALLTGALSRMAKWLED